MLFLAKSCHVYANLFSAALFVRTAERVSVPSDDERALSAVENCFPFWHLSGFLCHPSGTCAFLAPYMSRMLAFGSVFRKARHYSIMVPRVD